ncbi:MAG TPA: amino acid ABC transporter permease [Clostridiales bacterium]|jgi:polar amino acid transport system permease protein|nr:amino acid ABC transporter permease [Clostridiales bacterium]HCG35579.1 amino acid ABC transporter permease [Clostridiales bacterium]
MGWDLKWQVFEKSILTSNVQQQILTGLLNTVKIAVVGLLMGIVVGTIIATVNVIPKKKVIPRRFDWKKDWYMVIGRAVPRILKFFCDIYVAFFRGAPIVVQLLLGYYVVLPMMGIHLNSVYVCMLIFGLNSGAYVAEIMRSGIQAVDPGQLEAGRAMGLSYPVSMIKIVIPQAIKNILPTLGNEFISLIKETSVVSFVGALDLYTAFKLIGSKNYEPMIPYIAMAVVYIGLVLVITLLVKYMERMLKKSDRRS